MDAVVRAKTGYEFGEKGLVEPKSGRHYRDQRHSERDDEIADLFAHSGRLSKQEVKKSPGTR